MSYIDYTNTVAAVTAHRQLTINLPCTSNNYIEATRCLNNSSSQQNWRMNRCMKIFLPHSLHFFHRIYNVQQRMILHFQVLRTNRSSSASFPKANHALSIRFSHCFHINAEKARKKKDRCQLGPFGTLHVALTKQK